MIKHAADISNYSGFLTAEKAAALRTYFDWMIVRSGPQSDRWEGDIWKYTRQQLLALQTAGVPRLDIYGWLSFAGEPEAEVEDALSHAQGFPIGMLWLDCEDDRASALTEQQTVDYIQRAADSCIGRVVTGIYTAPWWWKPQTGDSTQFSHFPNWTATDDRHGNLVLPQPYGGWVKATLEQFILDTFVEGIKVDINAYEEPDPVVVGGSMDSRQLLIEHMRMDLDQLEALGK